MTGGASWPMAQPFRSGAPPPGRTGRPTRGHAFVRGLGDGTLPRAAFLHYLAQDYMFLIHFSRAWALAVTKAETLDEMRACAATVQALIDDEMRLHVETCAAEGISAAALEATREAPANLAYTRYVLDAGHSGDFLDLMAALAPCVLGYGEIGAALAATAPPDGPYAGWIATYGGKDYQRTLRRCRRADRRRRGPPHRHRPAGQPALAAPVRPLRHRDAAGSRLLGHGAAAGGGA